MSKFIPGNVVYVKTTEEPNLILKTEQQAPAYEGFSGEVVYVRRPLVTDQGIKHINDVFFAEELETPEDKHFRVYNDLAGVRETFKGQAKDDPLTNLSRN